LKHLQKYQCSDSFFSKFLINIYCYNHWSIFMPYAKSIRKSLEFRNKSLISDYLQITGGDEIIEYNGYMIHVFKKPGDHEFVVNFKNHVPESFRALYASGTLSADIAVVGGGGAGGRSYGDQDTGKGGGGAGGVVFGTGRSVAAGTFPITVGRGAIGQPSGNNNAAPRAPSGGNSTGFGVTANGGGGGGGSDNHGSGPGQGGSGGGAGSRNPTGSFNNGASSDQPSFSGWTSYGNGGGNSTGGNFGGGGGGGAGGGGSTGSGNDQDSIGGNGGIGVNLGATFGGNWGESGFFGGGGGGGSYSINRVNRQALGGLGGGGRSNSALESSRNLTPQNNAFAIDAIDGTGGGGGGSAEDGQDGSGNDPDAGSASGSGGSGIVLVRYRRFIT
jgi:hypothetical protein